MKHSTSSGYSVSKIFFLFLALFLFPLSAAFALTGFYINETFKGSATSLVTFGGSPTKAYLTSGIEDPEGNGWLRLTNDEKEQKGYVIINQSFSSTNGVLIDMEFNIWRTVSDGFGGADGFSIFLYDASVTPFEMGGFGGSLGYAQRTVTTPEHGLTGGYVAIGFDEYGNFSNFSEGRDGGLGFGRTPNTIGIRGPGDKASNWMQGYTWLTGNSSLGFNLQAGQTAARPDEATYYRRVQVEITPLPSKQFSITARMMTQKDGTFTTVLAPYTLPTLPPANLKLGLAASTGQSVNHHDLRNLIITSSGGVRMRKTVDKATAKVGDELTYTIDVFNQTDSVANGLILKEFISQKPAYFKINSITFNDHGDSKNSAPNVSDPMNIVTNINAINYGTFTIKGRVMGYPPGGILMNKATVELGTSKVKDADIVNNTDSISTLIELANAPDFIVSQSADQICIDQSKNSTITLNVKNNGLSESTLGSIVTVKDTIPAGLQVVGYDAVGWTKTNAGNAYKFTRSDVLAKGATFPPINILVKQATTETNKSWTNIAYVENDSDYVKTNNVSTGLTLYSPADVNAGPDQTNYGSGTFTMAANNAGAFTGNWTVVNGSAAITNTSLPNTTVTLSPNSQATLRWTLSNSNCSNSDDVVLSYYVPKVTLEKKVTNSQNFQLGSSINYAFTVANAGLVPLDSVKLNDPMVVTSYASGDLNSNNKLDVGESWIYTGSYVVKQSDVDAGTVRNSATVTAKDPSKNIVSDVSGTSPTNDLPTVTAIEHINRVILSKTVTTSGPYRLNDKINYLFEVKNVGTTTLDSLYLIDNKLIVQPSYLGGDSIGGSRNFKLNVNETWRFSGVYTVKQSDVDFGKVSNLATVYCRDFNRLEVKDISGSNVPTVAYLGKGKVTLVKEVDTLATKPPFMLNDSVIYKFTIKNIGEVPLTNVVLTDLKFALSSPPVYKSGDNGIKNTMELNETWIYRGKYYVSQADIDAGRIVNSALVTTKYFDGITENNVASDSSGTRSVTDDPTITPVIHNAKVVLLKTVTNGVTFKLDDVIAYQFTVNNTGNVTLTTPVITDDMLDASPVYFSGDNNLNSKLDPGESWIFTGTHKVTTADVVKGKVVNSALVKTKDPQNNEISDISGTNAANNDPITSLIYQGPTALNDNAHTTNVSSIDIDIQGNDVKGKSDIDPASVQIVAQPANGTVTVITGGQIKYTPDKGFVGTDNFTYRVKDTDGNWSNIAVVTVVVGQSNLIIPNVFTPNGDGHNDYFVIQGLAAYDNAKLVVFNRWGGEFYTNNNYKNDWNAYGLNDGTYYYVLYLTSGAKVYKYTGWVLIKR